MDKNKKIKHFTASALIIDNNKVLLVYHKKLDVWLYPGGHVEKNENPDETLIREVKEETGLDVKIISNKDDDLSDEKFDVVSLHIPYAVLCELVGDHYHNDLIYLCEIVNENSNKLKHNSDESERIGFFGLDKIENLKMFNNFRVLINNVLQEIARK
ncbi:NUDIX domain-containing protein [bacterium]|nr:NUDIX domain-containing protein [bacterium]